MVTLQSRELVLEFAVTDTVTEPLPLPLVGETVTQLLQGLLTLQPQPEPVVMFTEVLDAPAPGDQLVGEIEKLPEPAAWVMEKL